MTAGELREVMRFADDRDEVYMAWLKSDGLVHHIPVKYATMSNFTEIEDQVLFIQPNYQELYLESLKQSI